MSDRANAFKRAVSRYRPGLRWYHWVLVIGLHVSATQPAWGVATNLGCISGAFALVYIATALVRRSPLAEYPLESYSVFVIGVAIAAIGAAILAGGELTIGAAFVVLGIVAAAWPSRNTIARKTGALSRRVQSE